MSTIIIPGNTDAASPQAGRATVMGRDGQMYNVTPIELSHDEALILRQYKKFLRRHGLREALYCQSCWNGDRHDGCEAHVTDSEIGIACRCRLRHYHGQTF